MFFDSLATIFTLGYFASTAKIIEFASAISTFYNCTLWLKYGILTYHISMIIVNLVGVLSSCYAMYHLSIKSRHIRGFLTKSAVVLMILLLILRWQYYTKAIMYTGFLACTCTVGMLASPLIYLRQVIKTKNASMLNQKRILLGLGMALCWTLVGLEHHDNFVMIPNGLGVVVSVIQYAAYVKYHQFKDYRQVN